MNHYLKHLIKDKRIPIVFDYDGVLFEGRWYEERINMPNETEEKLYEAMKRGKNLNTRPIPFMVEWVDSLDRYNLHVLSYMHNEIEYDFKLKQIAKFYPTVKKVIAASSVEDKINHLQLILEEYGGFIYIDDNLDALNLFENHFDAEHCKFFHVSSLYV